jgi:PAS domain S-box-containing protein
MKENQNLYKDIESRVAEKENDLMILFKNMINAFVLFRSVFDENGKFVSYSFIYINNAYEKITGFKNDEVKGKTVYEVWPENEPEWIEKYGKVAVTGIADSFEMFHKPTKKYYFCNVYNPFDNNERFCVILNDITDFKNTELELVKAKEKEEKAKIYLDNIIKPISNCVVVFLIVCNHDCNF